MMPNETNKTKVQHQGRLKGEMHDTEAVERAIKVCGGKRSHLAKRLNVSWQQVRLWLEEKSIITGERAVMIELVTNGEVKRDEIRPDLYRPIEGNYNEVGKG